MKKNQIKLGFVKNSADGENEKKQEVFLSIDKNAFVDEGNGVIKFKNDLVITDNTEQRNGTQYDIPSMDLSEFPGKLTANHSSRIENVLGVVLGLRKIANKRVVITGIKFAIEENALARYAYNMLVNGYLTDFSIETFGPYPDETGIYKDARLIGLSLVVVGNNRSATIKNDNAKAINKIVQQTVAESKELNLDTSIVENNYLCYDEETNGSNNSNKAKSQKEEKMFVTIKNSRQFAVTIKFTNAAGDEVEKTLQPGETVDVSSSQETALNEFINKAEDPSEKEEAKSDNSAIMAEIKKIAEKQDALEQKIFDNSAEEPGFSKTKTKTNNSKDSDLKAMDYRLRHGEQIVLAKQWLKTGNQDALAKLNAINSFHKKELLEAGIIPGFAANSIDTIDMGNFVISPELLSEIEGHRSDFKGILGMINYKESLSTKFAWLTRDGDIDMQPVSFLSDANDGNLKPLSVYGATYNEANMEELAAVTPVMNATNRFLAADLIGDIAEGYRTDYDRKKAQLLIAKLQQATDSTGNQTPYNVTSGATALQSWVTVWASITEEVPNGTLAFNYKTKGELIKQAIAAGFDAAMTQTAFASGETGPILGAKSVYVPNELMPSLGAGDTKTFAVGGANVTINQAVFYADLSKFKGRVSGGLQYDLSTEASYEEGGSTKSAFQRNELLLRGSFFRNGAFVDPAFAASLFSGNAS
jgi:hypothetical protein